MKTYLMNEFQIAYNVLDIKLKFIEKRDENK